MNNNLYKIKQLHDMITANDIEIQRMKNEQGSKKMEYDELCDVFESDFENYSEIEKMHYCLDNPNRLMSRKFIRNNYRIHLRKSMDNEHVTIKIDPSLLATYYDIIKCYDSFNYIVNYYGYSSCTVKVLGSYNSVTVLWCENLTKLMLKPERHIPTISGSMLDILYYIKNNVGVAF